MSREILKPEKLKEVSESDKIEKHIAVVFERGLDDEECLGYHGTSLESMQYLLKFGHLPGSSEADSNFGYQQGDLFFFPRESSFPENAGEGSFEKEAIKNTRPYAEILAEAHFIINALGLDLNDPENQIIGKELASGSSGEIEKIIIRLSSRLGKSEEDIKKIIKESKTRKGIIITIDKKAKNKFSVGSGDDPDGDLYLRCPNGLEYKYISGIEPIGQEEWDFFEKIQEKHHS